MRWEMKCRIIAANIAACLCLLLSANAQEQVKMIRFAEESNWPPFTLEDHGKATKGLSLDLMKAVFSQLKIEVEIDLLPQKRMLAYLKSGKRDGATVISKNKERLKFLDYTEPIFQKRGFVYYLAGRKPAIKWEKYEDLKGLRIGVVSGHNYGDEFTAAVAKHGLILDEVTNQKMNFAKLLSGRIDAFLCIEQTAKKYQREKAYKGKIVHADKSYYSKGYHIAFSKKSPAKTLIPRVNEVILKMTKDGTLAKIIAKHTD